MTVWSTVGVREFVFGTDCVFRWRENTEARLVADGGGDGGVGDFGIVLMMTGFSKLSASDSMAMAPLVLFLYIFLRKNARSSSRARATSPTTVNTPATFPLWSKKESDFPVPLDVFPEREPDGSFVDDGELESAVDEGVYVIVVLIMVVTYAVATPDPCVEVRKDEVEVMTEWMDDEEEVEEEDEEADDDEDDDDEVVEELVVELDEVMELEDELVDDEDSVVEEEGVEELDVVELSMEDVLEEDSDAVDEVGDSEDDTEDEVVVCATEVEELSDEDVVEELAEVLDSDELDWELLEAVSGSQK